MLRGVIGSEVFIVFSGCRDLIIGRKCWRLKCFMTGYLSVWKDCFSLSFGFTSDWCFPFLHIFSRLNSYPFPSVCWQCLSSCETKQALQIVCLSSLKTFHAIKKQCLRIWNYSLYQPIEPRLLLNDLNTIRFIHILINLLVSLRINITYWFYCF